MDKEKLQRFLVKTENQGISMLYNRGYQWIKSNFLPHLNLAEEVLPDAAEVIADCWYLMGDVYDFNDAPLKAIEHYERALACDEDTDGAYREIGMSYQQIGRYQEALDYINIALERMPDDEELMDVKASIQDDINYNHTPYWGEDNAIWQVNELLAKEAFEEVIAKVTAMDNPELVLLQGLAKAYGAQNDIDAYLQTWEQIVQSEEHFHLEYSDWFYMPKEIYKGARIWELIQQAQLRIDEANFIYFDSLFENYEDELPLVKLVDLICQFQIHRAKSATAAIQQLAKDYPLWEEVQKR